MKYVFLALLFVALVRSATRVGIYSAQDCTEESLIGFVYYPDSFSSNSFSAQSCTAAGETGQYYNVVLDVPAETQAERREDWIYMHTQTGDYITSCDELTESVAIVTGGAPDTCFGFGDPFTSNGFAATSFSIATCVDGHATANTYSTFDCSGTEPLTLPLLNECSWTNTVYKGENVIIYGKLVCPPPVAAPVAAPVASSTPTAATPSSSNSPVKKTSLAATVQLSLVAATAVAAVLML